MGPNTQRCDMHTCLERVMNNFYTLQNQPIQEYKLLLKHS